MHMQNIKVHEAVVGGMETLTTVCISEVINVEINLHCGPSMWVEAKW
jgi:hypothetical protein